MEKITKRRKKSIKTLTESLQKEMLNSFEKYNNSRKELALHEGKLIDEVGLKRVNELLKNIQDTFRELYPVLNFIQIYHHFSTGALNDYGTFIDSIKKQGANEIDA